MTDAEYLAMENSTIVRSRKKPKLMPLARAGSRALSTLAPSLAAGLAERLFLTPPRPHWPASEIAQLSTARARPLQVGKRHVDVWLWGSGPSVLLVHGWGGRGAQLASFVEPLVAHGFSVVTFDAPGHGPGDSGMVTIPEMVDATRAVAASRGPLLGLIAHSVGATVAARAMYEGLDVTAAVFVGPAADLAGPATRFTATLGFSREVRDAMQARIEARVGRPFAAFDVAALAPALRAPLLHPRSRRRRDPLAARPGDRARLARGGAADDRRPRPSPDPARSRCGRRRGRLPGRAEGRAAPDAAGGGRRRAQRSAGRAPRGDLSVALRLRAGAPGCAGSRRAPA